MSDFNLVNPNTEFEDVVFADWDSLYKRYAGYYDENNIYYYQEWDHVENNPIPRSESEFKLCPYYVQRNKGFVASHTIFNYANISTRYLLTTSAIIKIIK